MYKAYGIVRVTVASPHCSVGNPDKNVEATLSVLGSVQESDVVVFPELGITGYTCADLFRQQLLLERSEEAVAKIATNSQHGQLIFIGVPIAVGSQLYNCAVALQNGTILGVVPKQNIPNYNEFYESRWFRGADGNEPKSINYAGQEVPFGIDLLFSNGTGVIVHAEICEDLWMPIPPSCTS